MKFLKKFSKRWMRKQMPTSDEPTLDRELLRQDIGFATVIFTVAVLLCLLVVKCTRPIESKTPAKSNASVDPSGQTAQEPPAHMIYFSGSRQGLATGSRSTAPGLPRGTLVRVRLMNSLQTFETVPAFAQVVDYSLGQGRYGATLIGDASGDGSVERIKINFNTLKLLRPAQSVAVEGHALSLDGTFGLRATKLEGFMGRAVTSGAQAGAAGLGNFGGAKGDLNQFLLKALLSGLQTELSSDLSAAHARDIALSLDPGTEFLVQLTSDFVEGVR